MAFGTAYRDGGDFLEAEPSRDVFDVARQCGERLAADLAQAEKWTDGWRNQELGAALVERAMSDCLAVLAATGCWGKANELPSSELWRAAGTMLERGALNHRARFKPRGYAGDDVMLRSIWLDTACDDPLGRLLDRYFLAQAAPRAVVSRAEEMAAAIVEHILASTQAHLHVVSIGSGPGVELERVLELLPSGERRRLRFTLIDLDGDALDGAQARLAKFAEADSVRTLRENLYRLHRRAPAIEAMAEADFVFSSGFFDYLEPARAADLLRLMWGQLNAGGRLAVGNFAPHNPTRAYMEWIGNWYLIYRRPAELEQLAADAGIPAERSKVRAERLGIDLFLWGAK